MRKKTWAWIWVLAVVGCGIRLQADELTSAKCDQLLKELQPNPKAPWRTIPWQTNLLQAQQQAVEESKPIFIWAMDGHPLGCT